MKMKMKTKMKIKVEIRAGAAVAALGLALGWAQGWALHGAEAWKLPPETARLKSGPGVELAAGQCLLCHSADYLGTQPPQTRAGWEALVKKMREKYGAPIPADKTNALVEYLTENYGRKPSPGK